MDINSNTPLNKAHRFARKAEDDEKLYKFDAAIDNHRLAACSLREALMICSNDKARESLDSQLAFHEARQGLLSQRKVHFQKRTEEHQKRKAETVKAQQKDSNTVICLDETETERHQIHLESEIYRVIEEHDSLLQFLCERQDPDLHHIPTETNGSTISLNASSYKCGKKEPKGDKTVIEELKMNNDQLRQLVHQLVGELEKLQTENHQLRVELITSRAETIQTVATCSLPELPPLEPPKLLY